MSNIVEGEKRDAENEYALLLLRKHFARYVKERVSIKNSKESEGFKLTGGFQFRDRLFQWLFEIPSLIVIFVKSLMLLGYILLTFSGKFPVEYLERELSSERIVSTLSVLLLPVVLIGIGSSFRMLNVYIWRSRLIKVGYNKYIKPEFLRVQQQSSNYELVSGAYCQLRESFSVLVNSSKIGQHAGVRGGIAAVCFVGVFYIWEVSTLFIKLFVQSDDLARVFIQLISGTLRLTWVMSLLFADVICLIQYATRKRELD